MKKFNLFTIAVLLALIATSCSKEDGRFSLVANQMRNNSKINMDTDNNGTWVVGEMVLLNGVGRTIAADNGNYYLADVVPQENQPYKAIYPYLGLTGADGNGNVVSINDYTITITNLVVDFDGQNYKVMFPMATKNVTATSNTCPLLFDHATAALKLTLKDTSMASDTLSSIKVFTQAIGPVSSLSTTDQDHPVSAQWKIQGPSVPVGEIGYIDGDQIVGNGCEMNFTLKTENRPNKTFVQNQSVTFCVPLTVDRLNKISVIGYDQDGKQVFTRTKVLNPTEDQSISANVIYPVPTIEF